MFPLFFILFAMKRWDQMPLFYFFNVEFYSTFFTLLFHPVTLWKEFPYDPTIPLLGTYLKETVILKRYMDSHIWCSNSQSMETACLPVDEWNKKLWCIYKTEYYSALKKKKILSSVMTWMSLEEIMLSEIKQASKEKQIMRGITSM